MTDSASPCETAHPPDPRWVGWIAWALAVGFVVLVAIAEIWPHARFFRPVFLGYFVAFSYGFPIVNPQRSADRMSIRGRLVFSAIFGTLLTGIMVSAALETK